MSSITATSNGPYKAEDVSVYDADGKLLKEGTVFLCRCGQSKTKPFCDGTHKEGFDA